MMRVGIAPPNKPDRRYYTLDGMRGGAAIAVALYHLLPTLAPAGYIAVDLFFVMSGVVLMQAYAGRLASGMSLVKFMTIRIIRLYPLYILGTLVGFLVNFYIHGMPLKQTLASIPSALLMLPAPLFHNGELYPFNGASWSLFFEMAINAWLAIYLFRARKGVLVAVMVVSALALVPLSNQHYHLNLGFRISPIQLLGGTARVCFSFLCGILLYRWQRGQARPTSAWAIVVLLATVLALMIAVPPAWLAGRDLILALAVSPLLVFAAIQVEPPAGLRRSFELLGDLSYPLYAVHFPTVILWRALFTRFAVPPAVQATIYVAGLVVLSAVLVRYYDELARAQLSRWAGARESARPQVL